MKCRELAKKSLLSLRRGDPGKKRCDIFVFDIFDRFSFEAGRQYALDVFQSRGEPAL